MLTTKKMYVLVRKDLEQTYRNVQGSHAIAEYSLRGNKELYYQWNNETLIFLIVSNEWALEKWSRKLKDRKKFFVQFFEPDLRNELTAIACLDTGEVFKNLQIA